MNSPARILIVEDEYLIASALAIQLEMAGYRICGPVDSGGEAVRMVESAPPDLVVMDVRLAGEMDGIQAAREIRATCDVPILFMTGYLDCEPAKQLGRWDRVKYLAKPVSPAEIESAIAELLEEGATRP